MIIKLTHKVKVDPNTKEFPLRIYLEGSGKKGEEHKIVAFTLDYKGFGIMPALKDIDRFEDQEGILV